ncbi:MAG: aromatic ring-hydroxylating dioxygenase subunit alpha [Myxococcota bacterium]
MVRERRLGPPATKGISSAARVLDDWYVAAQSQEVGRKPIARTILGIPLVLYRGDDGVSALLDRCPHRNVPLSLGRVEQGTLQCGYHGWRFDGSGACVEVPGLCGAGNKGTGRRVDAFPTREEDGFIWVYATAGPRPERDPYRFPHLRDPAYTTVRQTLDVDGTLHAAAENALDVLHTHFLHRGLFRSEGERNEIEVVVRRWPDRVEAQYIGEPRPEGLIGRVLAPGGGVVEHYDRFLLPCIAQVEYRLGDDAHIIASTALTPIADLRTRMFGVVTFRLRRLPPRVGGLAARVLKPLGMVILRQDAAMLAQQTRTIRHFGGEQYFSTEVDVLGPQILRLLRRAERGGRTESSEGPVEKTLRMRV